MIRALGDVGFQSHIHSLFHGTDFKLFSLTVVELHVENPTFGRILNK